MDPTNAPCFVKSYDGESMSGGEATDLSAEDLFGVWIVLAMGALVASVTFIGELVLSDIVLRNINLCNKRAVR